MGITLHWDCAPFLRQPLFPGHDPEGIGNGARSVPPREALVWHHRRLQGVAKWLRGFGADARRGMSPGCLAPFGHANRRFRLRKTTLPPLSCGVTPRPSTTGNNYNADLGNGADGWQATAIRQPQFFVRDAPLRGLSQPSAAVTHRSQGGSTGGCSGGEPVGRLAFRGSSLGSSGYCSGSSLSVHRESPPCRTGFMELK